MKFIRQICAIVFLLSIVGCAARPARAQFIGYTSPQTTNQNIFNAASCATSPTKSASVANIGQSVHVLTYSFGSSVSTNANPIVRIMGSFDGTNFVQLSDDGLGAILSGTQRATLTGYGAYPFVQIWVFGGNTGCVITANYMGTSVSTTNPTGSSDVTAYDKILLPGGAAGTTQTISTFIPPYGNTAGYVTVVYSGAGPAGSSIAVTIQDQITLQSTTIASFNLAATSNVIQMFAVPSVPTGGLSLTYTAGGASANNITIEYAFLKPGANPNPQCEKTLVINTAAAGPTQIIAGSGGASPRICSVNVGSGTAEAIDFQQGTGTNCATGNAQLTGLTHLAANAPWIQNFPQGGLVAGPGNAVCIHLSGANQTDGTITYSDY